MLKVMQISNQDVDLLIFTAVDIDADIYFQYLRMRMLKSIGISADKDVDIRCSLSL